LNKVLDKTPGSSFPSMLLRHAQVDYGCLAPGCPVDQIANARTFAVQRAKNSAPFCVFFERTVREHTQRARILPPQGFDLAQVMPRTNGFDL